jgi:hypothetical protein
LSVVRRSLPRRPLTAALKKGQQLIAAL